MKTIVEHLRQQMYHASSLMKMHQRLDYSPEVTKVFCQTWEAHGFSLIQQSVLFELVFVLCRFHDETDNTKSFPTLFKDNEGEFKAETFLSTLSPEQFEAFSNAKSAWKDLKGSHLLSKTKALRNKFWAHSAHQSTKVQLPKYEYIDDLYLKSKQIVEDLSYAILEMDPNFEEVEEHWSIYSDRFFLMLVEGQRRVLRSENCDGSD